MADWDKARAAAMKILGRDAEVPDFPSTVAKAFDDHTKAFEEFKKFRDQLEQTILRLENANSGVVNAVKQFKGQIEKSDFNLNPKSSDDKKKIQQAEKILCADLDGMSKDWVQSAKNIEELDRHLAQIGKYKSPAKN